MDLGLLNENTYVDADADKMNAVAADCNATNAFRVIHCSGMKLHAMCLFPRGFVCRFVHH